MNKSNLSALEARVSPQTIISYGLPSLPLALFAITFFVYIPKFYSDVAGASLSAIGILLVITRIWDAITDPWIGRLSDRTVTRWGRRKPWLLFSTVPLLFFFFLILQPSMCPDYIPISVWFGGNSILFFLFWTTFSVPYEALGAEISPDYKQRNLLLGFRDGALVLGTLLAGIVPAIVFAGSSPINSEASFKLLAIVYSCILLVAIIPCLRYVGEQTLRDDQSPNESILESIKHVVKNKPFCILLAAYTISALGAGLPPVLMSFYVDYWLGVEDPSIYLVIYFVSGFIFLPLWIFLASKIGKKEAWIAAMLVNSGAFAGVFFLSKGSSDAYMLLVGLSGVGYGASLALPSSMQADVIDLDEFNNHTRKEGQFIGFWSIARKLAAALGGGLGLATLEWSGYQANIEQTDSTLLALRVLYAAIPCLCNFIAIGIAWQYSIDEKLHNEIRASLDSRRNS